MDVDQATRRFEALTEAIHKHEDAAILLGSERVRQVLTRNDERLDRVQLHVHCHRARVLEHVRALILNTEPRPERMAAIDRGEWQIQTKEKET